MRMIPRLLFVLVVLAVFGCVSAQDKFLLASLDRQAKARALVEEGAEQYQIQLIRKGDLSKVAVVREYFTTALRYDPANVLAARYRDLVDNFKTARLNDALKEARAYLARQKRREEDDYAMCLAIQAARSLDPANATAARLARDTEKIRQGLIALSISRARTSLAQARQASTDSKREEAFIEAYQSYRKALVLDPGNAAANGGVKSLAEELDRMAARHVASVNRLVASGRFESADEQIAHLEDVNRKVGGILEARVTAARYALDYQWARSLYARKSYVQADAKVNEALSLLRTEEALGLKRKIADLAAQAEQQATLDASLQQIDGLIEQGELVAASSRIEALAKRTEDRQSLDLLDARRDGIRSALQPMYETAVDDYRNEDFKGAIELLRTIVSIDVGYEQAADYLDKATAKEKLIEQY